MREEGSLAGQGKTTLITQRVLKRKAGRWTAGWVRLSEAVGLRSHEQKEEQQPGGRGPKLRGPKESGQL